MEDQKSLELIKIIEEFRKYLQTEEAKSHIRDLKLKEPKETKQILEDLRKLDKDSQEFVDTVLYGLLPNAKTKYSKRVSIAPAFLNIRKFFKRFSYNDEDWKHIANLVFNAVDKFDKNPNELRDIIKYFVSNKYSKALQCGSMTPILYAINNDFPIVNNREIRTFNVLSRTVFSERKELDQKLESYPSNIEKINHFVKILSEKYEFNEIKDMGIFDLFCYWFDEKYRKESKIEKLGKEVRKKVKEDGLFEPTEDEQAIAIPKEQKRVIWQPKDFSIRELYEMYKDGDLDPRPKFQRYFVWDDKKSSRLIESILLEVPIPNIYLAEDDKGRYSVVDGQQRLTSFINFMDGNLTLRGLLVLDDLNGKKFSELDKEDKSKFKKSTIHTIVIKRESQKDIRFEIFERLNTGSVKLNDQELRNCIYRGAYNQLLDELSHDRDFLELLGLKKPHKRMLDRELILRFFALYHKTYLRYEPPMKSFLNNEMETRVNLDENERTELKNTFKKSVDLTKAVFGRNAFKRFIIGSEIDPNGTWEGRRINKALFDIVMYGFTDYEKQQIYPKIDMIREELIWLMTHDQAFIDAITISTNDKSKVLERFEKWLRSLREIVGYPVKETRAFSSEVKRNLFNTNNTCRICQQEIRFLDDAEVDHIDFYWKGGKTIPSNARLVHRFCNRHRGGRG
ncbi:MAG: HNH endonuclease family protein [Candidatus Helarchaeota archaeon]